MLRRTRPLLALALSLCAVPGYSLSIETLAASHLFPRDDSIDGNLPVSVSDPSMPFPPMNSSLLLDMRNLTIPPSFYSGLQGVNLAKDAKLVKMVWFTIFLAVGMVFTLRLAQLFVAYIRNIFCMTATPVQQTYYTLDHFPLWTFLKRHLVYAPLLHKRHNRELQMSSVVNYGTIPGRIHTLLLGIYILSNMVYCLMLDWNTPEKGRLYAELRGRSGILATVNCVPLVLLAARNNPAIAMLRVSFDAFNLFHRWLGRLVVMEALIHFFAWLAAYLLAKGSNATGAIFHDNKFLQFGLVGLIAMIGLALHSPSPLRHAFYETFLHLHQTLGFLALFGTYAHVASKMLPAFPFILTACLFWFADRLWRVGRILFLNYARGGGRTMCTVEALPAKACRVTFQLPRHVTIRPGSHVYAYIPAVSQWMSHPFSVAWTNAESDPLIAPPDLDAPPKEFVTLDQLERQSTRTNLAVNKEPTRVSLVVCARSGMTKTLYDRAFAAESKQLQLTGFLEGPYAGHDSMISYGTVVMFAGGGGITHHLIQIRQLLKGARSQTVATRKIVLVWSIRDTDAMEWVKPWMTEILNMEGRREVLSIRVYASRPTRAINQKKNKATMQVLKGRADPLAILQEVIPQRIGAMMVSVCGPGALADEVRAAVRGNLDVARMDFNEESFTW